MPEYDAVYDKHCRLTKTRSFSRHLRKQRAAEGKSAGSKAERAVRKAARELQRELSGEGKAARASQPAALLAEITEASEREARMATLTRAQSTVGRRRGERRQRTRAATTRKGKGTLASAQGSRASEPALRTAPVSAGHAAGHAQRGDSAKWKASVVTTGLPPLMRRHSAASLALPTSPQPRAVTALGRGEGAGFSRPVSRATLQTVSLTSKSQAPSQAPSTAMARVPSRYMASATYPFACVSGRQSDSLLVVRKSGGETAEADDVLHTRTEPERGPFLGPLAALNDIGVDTRPLSRAKSRLGQSTTALDIRRDLILERAQQRDEERAAAAEEERARQERVRRHAEVVARREEERRQQQRRNWSGSLPSPTAIHVRRQDDAESLRRAMAEEQEEHERREEAAARVTESYAEHSAMREAVVLARRAATAWTGRATRPTTSLLQRSAAVQRSMGQSPTSRRSPKQSPSKRKSPHLRRGDTRRALARSLGVSVSLVNAVAQWQASAGGRGSSPVKSRLSVAARLVSPQAPAKGIGDSGDNGDGNGGGDDDGGGYVSPALATEAARTPQKTGGDSASPQGAKASPQEAEASPAVTNTSPQEEAAPAASAEASADPGAKQQAG